MRVLGLIPARANSERLPGKHLLDCAGKPLIEWTIEAATAAKMLSRVVNSTDCHEIINRYNRYAVRRAESLGGPHVPTIAVARYVVRNLEDLYDAVCILQPTSPLRTADDIDECIGRLLLNPWADSVISYSVSGSQYTLTTNGAIYLVRTEVLAGRSLMGRNWLPYIMPASHAVDIDTAEDLAHAEILLSHRTE